MFTDPTWFTVSLVLSGIGAVLLHYGRKLRRWPQGVAGAALLVYPYFVPSVLPMAAIGVGVLLAMLIALRLGL
ncbi:MAG TPA: amino acid transport protein [Polyangia bacterium]|nr:amino acid transport protein [Polyangia bacterium]